ncbi:MAG: hypothetical protein V3V72_10060 [Ignavibacteriaceae bacterium]|jgi:hypothetical protein
MELTEIISSTILLFSIVIILLFTFSYVIYKLKNQTWLQLGFSKVQGMHAKSGQVKVEDLGKDQLSKTVFNSIDDRVQFSLPKVTNRFEIVNESLQIKNKSLKESIFN